MIVLDSCEMCRHDVNGHCLLHRMDQTEIGKIGEDCDFFKNAIITKGGKMEYVERQAQWIKENRIVKGSIVRVTRVADDYEDGWDNFWLRSMHTGMYRVDDTNDVARGIILRSVNDPATCYRYPYFVLDKTTLSSK